jgi:hypothetical protein
MLTGNLVYMEQGAPEMRLVYHPGDVPPAADDGPADLGLGPDDLDAARELAEYHRLLAAELEPNSQLRGLVLRCAGHWSRLGALPRNGLTEVERAGDE